jgi:hypothetical protein
MPLPQRIDTAGWAHVRHQKWHKDRRYSEVWVSNDGKSWTMLGMEGPPYSLMDVNLGDDEWSRT